MPELKVFLDEIKEWELSAKMELLHISPERLRAAQSRVETLRKVINNFGG